MLARRQALPRRAEHDAALAGHLAALLRALPGRCIGFYWPIQAEFDATPVIADWLDANPRRTAALPVVRGKDLPLDFHLWTPVTPMRAGAYGIPVPDGTEPAAPDILLIPCVSYDARKFRLGYGGGFYDRTLAALSPRPVTVGIGYSACRVESILPEAHDIHLDWIVDETHSF